MDSSEKVSKWSEKQLNKDNVINRQKTPTLIEKASSVETGKLGLMTETLAQKLVKSTSQVSKGSKSKTIIQHLLVVF